MDDLKLDPTRAVGLVQIRDILRPHFPALLDVVVQKALGGDMTAARLLIERAVPPLHASSPPVSIDTPANGTIASHGVSVLDAAFRGLISAAEAGQLLAGIGALAKFIETDQLASRIAALERTHADPVTTAVH